MSIGENINKAVCGGSEVYRALGEAHKALEEQEVRHRNEMSPPGRKRPLETGSRGTEQAN